MAAGWKKLNDEEIADALNEDNLEFEEDQKQADVQNFKDNGCTHANDGWRAFIVSPFSIYFYRFYSQ